MFIFRLFFSIPAFLGLIGCTTTSTTAGEIEGVVVIVGSAPNARPVLEPDGPKTQHEICPGSQQDFLRKFGGTVVKLTGEWSQHSVTKGRCFSIEKLKVVQLVKGRQAFTGILKMSADSKCTLTTVDGKVMTLERPSKGLKELVGKQVVLDLVPSVNTDEKKGGEPLWKVVTYFKHPVM